MPQRNQQPPTEPAASAKQEEMIALRCPTCNAHLLRYRATSDLQIEIKCRACSRKKKRGVWQSFIIHYQRPTEQT